MTPTRLLEDVWYLRFKPQLNHLDDNAAIDLGDGPISFETHSEELAFVRSVDAARVWTLLDDCDTIVSGYCLVNRMNYFVCEVPVPDGEDYWLELGDGEYNEEPWSTL